MKRNNDKIKKVYDFTVAYIDNNGFPPSVREICNKLSIKSTATAYSYLEKLKSMGLLDKSPMKKRAISIANRPSKDIKSIPFVGTISAGTPILAVENLEGYYTLPDDFTVDGDEFALRVKGDSMINAGIFNNDVIIVKQRSTAINGEIVVALIDDSATVKRFYKKSNKIILHPENDTMQDMEFDDVKILGIVKGLIRKF